MYALICIVQDEINKVAMVYMTANVFVRYKWTKCYRPKVTLGALKFCSKWVCALILTKLEIKNETKKHTPLYEKDTKQNQNSPMETTRIKF